MEAQILEIVMQIQTRLVQTRLAIQEVQTVLAGPVKSLQDLPFELYLVQSLQKKPIFRLKIQTF